MIQVTRQVVLAMAALLAAAGMAGCTQGAVAMRKAASGGQQPQDFKRTISKTVACRYWLYLPQDYGKEPQRKWPLMLFLHGAGERGTDVNRVKIHGPPSLVDKGRQFPFIIVSPQCPEGDVWSNDVLKTLVDTIIETYSVDRDRVYCTGLSMGGYGTWNLATEYPDLFAAIVPICGGGNWIRAPRLKPVPVWAFHGARDDVVPLDESQRMVNAVNKNGGSAKLTVYPEANHNAWAKTYANQEVYDWLLAHRRGAK